MEFNLSIATALATSTEDFPVDFDVAWQWLGYFDKATAKRALLSTGFIQDVDFRILAELSPEPDTGWVNPKPKEQIFLTVDCLKHWAMMAGTSQGRTVRLYFLECEKIAKQKQQIALPTPKELAYMLIASEEAREKVEAEKLALAAKIDADEPATILGKAITKAKNNLRIGEFAKSIGMGQNKYFEELRECQIIMATSTLPYQRFISSGYFVVTQVIHNEKTYPVSLVTPKGQAYLAKRHQQYLASVATMRIIEAEVSALV